MASGSEILKELFISLGWKYDESSSKKVAQAEHKTTLELEKESKAREAMAKKARESLDQTLKTFAKYTAAAQVMAVGVIAAVEAMATSFEKAYYSSSRTGASVKQLNAFSYAASQMGSSAEEAQSAVEGLAKAQREMPGYAQMLRGLGAKNPANLVQSLNDIAPKLASMPLAQAEAYSKVLNIPEHLLLAMRQLGDFRRFEEEGSRKFGILGFDPDKAAEGGKKLTQAFRSLYDTIADIVAKTGSGLFEKLQPSIENLNAFLLQNGDKISNALIAMCTAVVDLAKQLAAFVQSDEVTNFFKTLSDPKQWEGAKGFFGWFTQQLKEIRAIVKELIELNKDLNHFFHLDDGHRDQAAGGARDERRAASGGLTDQRVEDALGAPPGDHRPKDADESWWHWAKRKLGFERDSGKKRQQVYRDTTNYTGDNASVLKQAAAQLGTSPHDLAMVISYETAGTFSPSKWGGKGGNYMGLIQFGPEERSTYGANDRQTFAQQMPAVVSYLKSRGFKPGMSLLDLYSTINAGSPGHYNASDQNGTVRSHVARMQVEHEANVHRFLATVAKQHLIHLVTSWPGGRGVHPAFGGALPGMHAFRPIGGSPTDSSRHVTIHQHNHNHVTGVSDPTAAAAQIGARQDKHSSLLLRNMQSAIV